MEGKRDRLERKLDRLADSLEAVAQADLDSVSVYGPVTVAYPVHLALECRYLVSDAETAAFSTHPFENRLDSLRRELDGLLERDRYRERARTEVEARVDDYSTTVCQFLELGPLQIELENDLGGRDVIESLLRTFDGDSRIEAARIRTGALDDVLRCRYEANVGTILEQCPDIERPYYPDSFWWRHPSKVAAELDDDADA